MKELSTDAQHLVKLTRGVDGPDHQRRNKVRAGLGAALAAGSTSAAVNAALAEASPATPTLAATGPAAAAAGAVKGGLLGGGMLGGIATGIGLGTVILATAHYSNSTRSQTTPAVTSAASTSVPAATQREALPRVASSTLESPAPARIPPVAREPLRVVANQRPLLETLGVPVEANTTATLGDETRLLAQTQLAIRSSDPERALALVEEYERRFSRGSLLEEARAARVLALCKAGRIEEGRAAAVRFEQQFSKSPLVPRVRRSCDLVR